MTQLIPPLSQDASDLIDSYIEGLSKILGEKLYGIYMYGAGVFPDTGPLLDIDCHVIIRQDLTETERDSYLQMVHELGERFPGQGDKLDAYVILLKDAKKHQIPQHRVLLDIYDHSWALHCAHIRAGYYHILFGPEPDEIFPTPPWDLVDEALQHELKYVLDHPQYPAYGILNLCRILYSYINQDPAISKQFSGRWGMERYPQWAALIQAGLRFYRLEHDPTDLELMSIQQDEFYAFMHKEITGAR